MFTTFDIAIAKCRSCDKNEKLRLQALLLVKNGLSPAKVAEDLSVYRSTVHRWMKRAEEEGLYNVSSLNEVEICSLSIQCTSFSD